VGTGPRWSRTVPAGPGRPGEPDRVVVATATTREHGITFQRTKIWEETNDPDRDTKLARIEHVTSKFPDRVFAFDEFGPRTIRTSTRSAGTRA
jgi:hypothetical protein